METQSSDKRNKNPFETFGESWFNSHFSGYDNTTHYSTDNHSFTNKDPLLVAF